MSGQRIGSSKISKKKSVLCLQSYFIFGCSHDPKSDQDLKMKISFDEEMAKHVTCSSEAVQNS